MYLTPLFAPMVILSRFGGLSDPRKICVMSQCGDGIRINVLDPFFFLRKCPTGVTNAAMKWTSSWLREEARP
jgi:hypothetical protein